MRPTKKVFQYLTAVALVTMAAASQADSASESAPSRDDAIQDHAQALEASGHGAIDDILDAFDEHRFSAAFIAETGRDERRVLLATIAGAAVEAGGAILDESGDEVRLSLLGPTPIAIVFQVEPSPPFAINALRVEVTEDSLPRINISWDNAEATFKQLESEGFSGVVHLSRNGRVVVEKAYGSSNEELGFQTQLNTIYGIGSTPIDFTVAAIFLLEQDGKVRLDDRVSEYLADVPDDKLEMTLGQLITGQSGLPDFHDAPGDGDRDLGWINRDEAVARILAQPLRFVPGQGEAHSHSAYGLVAAIVEIVSGKSYFEFLRERIFMPAGMSRTGMYGDRAAFAIRDFAEGRDAQAVGIPNIPPNWGPTSWLVMGSGGMYSTLADMLRFYSFVRSDKRFEPENARRWSGEYVSIGGSERGFYMFHVFRGRAAEAMLLMNGEGRSPKIRDLSQALEALVMDEK